MIFYIKTGIASFLFLVVRNLEYQVLFYFTKSKEKAIKYGSLLKEFAKLYKSFGILNSDKVILGNRFQGLFCSI